MRTHEEIKKGMDVCRDGECVCDEICPYAHNQLFPVCRENLMNDALTYIYQLEEQLATPYKMATMKDVEERLKCMGINCCYGEDEHD